MILALNTAQQVHEMALLESDLSNSVSATSLLLERQWPSQRDDVERLVPTLKEMLEELGLDKKDISKILVINGPGPFTAVRTGVAFAQALAEGLRVHNSSTPSIHQQNTFELLRRKVAIKQPLITLLPAGGFDVGLMAFNAEGQIINEKLEPSLTQTPKVGPLAQLLADFPHDQFLVTAELKPELMKELHSICLEKNWKEIQGHKLQTLGESLLTFGLPEATANLDVLYLKGPQITLSKNKWKQS